MFRRMSLPLVVAVSLALAACGKGNPAAPEPKTEATASFIVETAPLNGAQVYRGDVVSIFGTCQVTPAKQEETYIALAFTREDGATYIEGVHGPITSNNPWRCQFHFDFTAYGSGGSNPLFTFAAGHRVYVDFLIGDQHMIHWRYSPPGPLDTSVDESHVWSTRHAILWYNVYAFGRPGTT